MPKNLGRGLPPPPNLDKIQKKSSFFSWERPLGLYNEPMSWHGMYCSINVMGFMPRLVSPRGRGRPMSPNLSVFTVYVKSASPFQIAYEWAKIKSQWVSSAMLASFTPKVILVIGPESDHWLCLSLTDSLTHWLTHSVTFSRLDWCDPGVWRCQLKVCYWC